MKNLLLYLIFMLCFCSFCAGQTSMSTELSRVDLPKDYLLRRGGAKKIIVTKIINPRQEYSYSDKTVYTFPEKLKVELTYYKNSDLESTRKFSIDSLNRITTNVVRFKHKALGWRVSNYETVYNEKMKDLKILNQDGSLNYTMRVIFNELDNPTEIRTLNRKNQLVGFSTAEYSYGDNTYTYKVYREDGTIVLNKIEPFKNEYEIKRNEFGDLVDYYVRTSTSDARYNIEYMYDDQGNWTKMEKILLDSKGKRITEIINRRIKYLKN